MISGTDRAGGAPEIFALVAVIGELAIRHIVVAWLLEDILTPTVEEGPVSSNGSSFLAGKISVRGPGQYFLIRESYRVGVELTNRSS